MTSLAASRSQTGFTIVELLVVIAIIATLVGLLLPAGRYELSFLRDIAGANVGSHTVRITTATEDRGGKEILPDRYHAKTELTAAVEPGSNTLDFPLRSK